MSQLLLTVFRAAAERSTRVEFAVARPFDGQLVLVSAYQWHVHSMRMRVWSTEQQHALFWEFAHQGKGGLPQAL